MSKYRKCGPRDPNRGVPRNKQLQCFERDGYSCRCCGRTEALTAGHVLARSEGGTCHLSNLESICAVCHYIDDKGIYPDPSKIQQLLYTQRNGIGTVNKARKYRLSRGIPDTYDQLMTAVIGEENNPKKTLEMS